MRRIGDHRGVQCVMVSCCDEVFSNRQLALPIRFCLISARDQGEQPRATGDRIPLRGFAPGSAFGVRGRALTLLEYYDSSKAVREGPATSDH